MCITEEITNKIKYNMEECLLSELKHHYQPFIIKDVGGVKHKIHMNIDHHVFRRTTSGRFVLVNTDPTIQVLLVPEDEEVPARAPTPAPLQELPPPPEPPLHSPESLLKKIEALERQVKLLQQSPDKRVLSAKSPKNKRRDLDEENDDLPNGKNDNNLLEDNSFTDSPKERQRPRLKPIFTKKPPTQNKLLHVNLNTLQTIRKWIARNKTTLTKSPYSIPYDDSADRFLLNVLFSFNPTVNVERSVFLDHKRECDLKSVNREYQDQIRKEDFAKELGLIHVNDKLLTAQSRRSYRQRKSVREIEREVAERMKLLRETSSKADKVPSKNTKTYLDISNTSSKSSASSKLNEKSSNRVGLNENKINRLYSESEDKLIIKFVLKQDRHKKVHGNMIWKELEEKNIMPKKRSWQSMRERYRKTILSTLRAYGLTHEQEMLLKVGARKGSIKQKQKRNFYEPKYKLSPSLLKSISKDDKSSKKSTPPKAKEVIKYRFSSLFKNSTNKKNTSDSGKKSAEKKRKLFSQKSFR